MYKYITNYVFKLFSLGHLIQIESDSFIWILDLGWARTPPFISTVNVTAHNVATNWKFFQTHEQTKNFGYTVINHKNADSIARSIARARDELATAEEHERYSAERNLEELQKQLQTFHSLSDQQRVRLAAAADSAHA